MNILFLTLIDTYSIEDRNIYNDLLREFRRHGHDIYIMSPVEKRNFKDGPFVIKEEHSTIVKVKIGNTQKTNLIEKGVSTITLERHFIDSLKKHLNKTRFDLVLYSTPPITLGKTVNYIKSRDNAKTYLLLKDIFPQNAIDIGILTKSGIKGIIYKYFRHKEVKLYEMSDYIGCMSQANVDYIIKNNQNVDPLKVEVCPNSIEINKLSLTDSEKKEMKDKYGIPQSKTIFIYGGNLGKPQGIDDMLKDIDECKDINDIFFVIAGSGTEYQKVENYLQTSNNRNVKLLHEIPHDDYNRLAASSDVGLIFLDHRFTIPNYPSRLLSYMQASVPVIAATDNSSDIGDTIESAGFGFNCNSHDADSFKTLVAKISKSRTRAEMGKKGFDFLKNNYTTSIGYNIIMKHFSTDN